MRRFFYTAKRLDAMLRAFPKLRRKLDAICVEYHQIQENFSNYDPRSNGERWLLQSLARQNRLKTVFDVGANHGDWAALVLEANPAARIHCFEICPPTFQKLSARFAGQAASPGQIFLNPFGLSDAEGEIKIQYCPDEDGQTTIFEVLHPQKVEILSAKVVPGRTYCASHGIQAIDVLKLDVEGAEHLVLRGFGDWLTPDTVPVVQFEYGLVNITTKFLLKDFYSYFESRGYRVGKLFPASVRFREYAFTDEDFFGPNYVAASPRAAELLVN